MEPARLISITSESIQASGERPLKESVYIRIKFKSVVYKMESYPVRTEIGYNIINYGNILDKEVHFKKKKSTGYNRIIQSDGPQSYHLFRNRVDLMGSMITKWCDSGPISPALPFTVWQRFNTVVENYSHRNMASIGSS